MCGSCESLSTPVPGRGAGFWALAPEVHFLNHGSFGSCPLPVLASQQQLRQRLEQQPVQFMVEDLEPLLDAARGDLAAFLGAAAEDLVFVPNATIGVNTVLRSYPLTTGDQLLVTDHEYNACRNALDFVAERRGAQVRVAKVPFPLASEEEITDAILACVTPRTRLALIDHITSPTGLVFPIAALVRALAERGIDTLVDGAHGPGMVPLDLEQIGAAFYTGNCHKWLCAPKGAGFLHIRRDQQRNLRPLAISHGANSPRQDRSRLQLEFGWVGTVDPTPWLCVPLAIACLERAVAGGWPEIMARNHQLVVRGRALLCAALDIAPPCPEGCLGALAAVALPPSRTSEPSMSPLYADPLQRRLRDQFQIEVPIIPWPASPARLVRISAQLYNTEEQYRLLAESLKHLLATGH